MLHATGRNTIGMKLVHIGSGSFRMGQDRNGDADEAPRHDVRISKPFFMSATPVTNAQYEQFDPTHKSLRGKRGFSKKDDEAVVFVSWHDAVRFCRWLSKKEGRPYRLPTEAEWEYACRAGTTSLYSTGKNLPQAWQRSQEFSWSLKRVSLTVGTTPPNRWGLCDMHGLVEEWCHDWYGPYDNRLRKDPVGAASGLFNVTRGGSHNTALFFLRSANRLATIPEDRHWALGFRVVQATLPKTTAQPAAALPLCMSKVSQEAANWSSTQASSEPYFRQPTCYIRDPLKKSNTPFYRYHHCPAITWCANGDLLLAWFTTNSEIGRELAIIASRLRAGRRQWDRASLFFNAPDRNMTGTSLFHDGHGRLYHANGLSQGDGWADVAWTLRTSNDNGATWSAPILGNAEHQPRNQIIAGMIMTQQGQLIQACDATYKARGGSAIHVSCDRGKTWTDPTAGSARPRFAQNGSGPLIAGIHAGVAQLDDGRLIALGRDNNINNRMPMSISADLGKSWAYRASPFPRISGCQRLVLMKLREGPLMFVSFTDPLERKRPRGLSIVDAAGKKTRIFGMFAALSYDAGKTWPTIKPITNCRTPGTVPTLDGRTFTLSPTSAEPAGYLAATQTPDNAIHLVSSYYYYCFSLSWLETPTVAR